MDSKSDVYTYFMSTQIISKSEGKSIILMHRKLWGFEKILLKNV